MRSAAVIFLLAVLSLPAAARTNETLAANEPGNVAPSAVTPAVPPVPVKPDDSAEAVFRAVGMFGTWAVDCGRPASPENPHVDVSAPGAGLVLENNDVGPEYAANRYSVLSARRLPGDRVEVNVIFRPGTPDEKRQTLVFEVRDGKRRTMFNRIDNGDIRVRHGVVLSRGSKTPLLRKCG